MPNSVLCSRLARLMIGVVGLEITSTTLPAAPPDLTPPPATVTRAQYLMGTIVEITAVAPTKAIAQEAATAGFQEVRRLEQLLSTWIKTSELSNVNAAAGRNPISVRPETLELLKRAVEIGELTDGASDITVVPEVRRCKVTEATRVPTKMELAISAQYVDYHLLRLDSKTRTVFLEKPGMQIDIGGIGKGYAAERAAAVMRNAGATGALIAVAGDFRIFGRRADGTSWPVGIQHPRRSGAVLATLESVDEAVSTSGDYERFFFKDGIRYHHILDPRTLQPARHCQSVTIVASDAITADGLATGVFVMGPEKGMALVERLGLGAVIVDGKGRVMISSRLRDRIHLAASSSRTPSP